MAQCARATPEMAVLLAVKAVARLVISGSLVVNLLDLGLFGVDAAREGLHRLNSAGRVGSVAQIMPTLCSNTLAASQYGVTF